MAWGLRQYRLMDFHEGFEWMRRTVLGIYSLFVSRLFSHLLITAGWCGLSPAYLMYHTFSCSESVRYVPSNPRYSPAFPSIPQHIPSPSSDRWRTFVEVRIDHILSPSSGSHYSLESTSLVTAALNAGASMTSLDPDLDLDLSPSLSSVTFLVYFSRVLQIINQ